MFIWKSSQSAVAVDVSIRLVMAWRGSASFAVRFTAISVFVRTRRFCWFVMVAMNGVSVVVTDAAKQRGELDGRAEEE